MAALPPKQMDASIQELADQFQTIFRSTVGADLSPQELETNRLGLMALREQIDLSVKNLPEGEQNPFQRLLRTTQNQLEQLSFIAERAHSVLNIARDTLPCNMNEPPRDIVAELCASPALAIALSYLSSTPLGAEDFPSAVEYVSKQRQQDIAEKKHALESTVSNHPAFQELNLDALTDVLKHIQLIADIVAEETNPKHACSFDHLGYAEHRMRNRSFTHLQDLFVSLPAINRQEIADELSRLFPCFGSVIEHAAMSTPMCHKAQVGNLAHATLAALRIFDHTERELTLGNIVQQICKYAHRPGNEQHVRLVPLILGQIKSLPHLRTTLLRIFRSPALLKQIVPDVLCTIRTIPNEFADKRDLIDSFILNASALSADEMEALIATLDDMPNDASYWPLYHLIETIPNLDHHVGLLLAFIDKHAGLGNHPSFHCLYSNLATKLCDTHHPVEALQVLAHIQSEQGAILVAHTFLKAFNNDKKEILQLIKTNITNPKQQQKMIELFNLI